LIDERSITDEIVYYRLKLINKDESTTLSSTLKMGQALPEYFMLEQNYPNPFNPFTTATVEVFVTSDYTVVVYDLVGNKISELYRGSLEQGIHKFEFDGGKLPSGIYFLEVSSHTSTQAIKMILAK
jgi:hypothetical protein